MSADRNFPADLFDASAEVTVPFEKPSKGRVLGN